MANEIGASNTRTGARPMLDLSSGVAMVLNGARAWRAAGDWFYDQNAIYFEQRRAANASPFGYSAVNGAARAPESDTITLTGPGAYVDLNGIPDIYDTLVFETVATIAPEQKLKFVIRQGSTTKLCFELDPASDQVIVTGLDILTRTLVPGNGLDLDLAAGVRIALCVRPRQKTAFICLRYYNSSGIDNASKQVTWFSDDVPWAYHTSDSVRFTTDAAGSGDVTLEGTVAFVPSAILDGDSIISGSSGSEWAFSPYPGFSGGASFNRDMDLGFVLGKALGKYVLNFGVASGGLLAVQALNTNLKRFRPKLMISNFGATNVLNVRDADGTTLSNLLAEVEAVIDNRLASGITVCSIDCIPRTWSFNAASASTLAQRYNEQQRVWAASKGIAHARLYDGLLGTGTAPNPALIPDGSHPNLMGKRMFRGAILQAVGDTRPA